MAKRQMIKNYEGKRKGEQGSIFKYVGKTKTTYGYILELPPSPTGRRNKSEKSGFATEFDAVLAKRKLEKITTTEDKNFEIIRLNEFYHSIYRPYLVNIKKRAVNTVKGYDTNIRDAIEYFGNIKLIDIRKKDRIKYQNYLIEYTNLKTIAINKKVNAVKIVLDYAVYMDYLSKNNFIGDDVEIPENEINEIKTYTLEEKEVIYREIRTITDINKYLIPCAIADTTGARIGEVVARTWSDFNFKKKTMTIHNALVRDEDGNFVLGQTKNKKTRVVAISDELIALLKKHKLLQKKNKLALGKEYIDSDFVCTYKNGQLVTHNTLKSLSDVLENRSIDFSFHRFRHTFATNAVLARANPKVLQEILGHSDLNTTMKYYVAINDEQKVEAVKSITEISHQKSFF